MEKFEIESINGYVLFRIFTYSDDYETEIFTSFGLKKEIIKQITKNVPSLVFKFFFIFNFF